MAEDNDGQQEVPPPPTIESITERANLQDHVRNFAYRITDLALKSRIITTVVNDRRDEFETILDGILEKSDAFIHDLKAVNAAWTACRQPKPQTLVEANPHNNPTIRPLTSLKAHFIQYIGTFNPDNANMLTTALNTNTLAPVVDVLGSIATASFTQARVLSSADQDLLVNIFQWKYYIAEPENWTGNSKHVTKARLILRPKDNHKIAMDDEDSRAFCFKVFGMVTEEAIGQYMEQLFMKLVAYMVNSDFHKVSKQQLFKLFLEFFFQPLFTMSITNEYNILGFVDEQYIELISKLEPKLNSILLGELLANQQQQQRQPNAHTRVTAGAGGHTASLPSPAAVGTVPAGFEPGGSKVPQQPPGAKPTSPLTYKDQPCFDWAIGLCSRGACPHKRPHDWAASTPTQQQITTDYAKLIKPWIIYTIYKYWFDKGAVPAHFPHRITR